MDELMGQVTQRAGIDQTRAKAAVDTVLDFLKERLPGGMLGGDRDR